MLFLGGKSSGRPLRRFGQEEAVLWLLNREKRRWGGVAQAGTSASSVSKLSHGGKMVL